MLTMLLSLTACVFVSTQTSSNPSAKSTLEDLLPAEGREAFTELLTELLSAEINDEWHPEAEPIDLDSGQIEDIADLLVDLGLPKILWAAYYVVADNGVIGYYFKAEGPFPLPSEFTVWLSPDGEVLTIERFDPYIQIKYYADGAFIYRFLPKEDHADYREKSRALVEQLLAEESLAAPDDIEFGDVSQWQVFRRTDDIIVISTVGIRNSDGVVGKIPFNVLWADSDSISIILNDLEYTIR